MGRSSEKLTISVAMSALLVSRRPAVVTVTMLAQLLCVCGSECACLNVCVYLSVSDFVVCVYICVSMDLTVSVCLSVCLSVCVMCLCGSD